MQTARFAIASLALIVTASCATRRDREPASAPTKPGVKILASPESLIRPGHVKFQTRFTHWTLDYDCINVVLDYGDGERSRWGGCGVVASDHPLPPRTHLYKFHGSFAARLVVQSQRTGAYLVDQELIQVGPPE